MRFDVEFDLNETQAQLDSFLEKGNKITPDSPKVQFKRWHDAVASFLKENFSDNSVADFFIQESNLQGSTVWWTGMSDEETIGSFDLACSRKALRKIIRGTASDMRHEQAPASDRKHNNNRVFVVHGHNEALLSQVQHLLHKLALDPIVLREEPNGGSATLIDKFEKNADVGFAVILMTADDKGGAIADVDSGRLSLRCRQNVILELGYFFGRLRRERVFVLKARDVEQPSDILGIVYQEVDSAGAWKYALGKELKSAGYSIDLNVI